MLTGRFPDAGERDPEALLVAYLDVLGDVIDEQGVEIVAAETDLSTATVETLADGVTTASDAPDVAERAADITLDEAAAVLARSAEFPDAETVAAEARDILLMGMTTAVMDVDAVASRLDATDPKTIQQQVEGRHPITLEEYARIHSLLEGAP
ncbi:DUF5791 family protein [Halapricum desulfuricans]|uniref:Putative transcriptional regulator, contains HTH domain n=1 Tax=Halapricum desulfuricans TaxID=2841257 RepID=A0A897N4E5_9EURY|nr:DUF5791 family protein [Halapricum desulfuricans]QSG07607.1 putative transcriptional regulator, contains HTH domain [Halapricum desulfuricans]